MAGTRYKVWWNSFLPWTAIRQPDYKDRLKDVAVLLNTNQKMQCIGCLSQPGKSLLAESCIFHG